MVTHTSECILKGKNAKSIINPSAKLNFSSLNTKLLSFHYNAVTPKFTSQFTMLLYNTFSPPEAAKVLKHFGTVMINGKS